MKTEDSSVCSNLTLHEFQSVFFFCVYRPRPQQVLSTLNWWSKEISRAVWMFYGFLSLCFFCKWYSSLCAASNKMYQFWFFYVYSLTPLKTLPTNNVHTFLYSGSGARKIFRWNLVQRRFVCGTSRRLATFGPVDVLSGDTSPRGFFFVRWKVCLLVRLLNFDKKNMWKTREKKEKQYFLSWTNSLLSLLIWYICK